MHQEQPRNPPRYDDATEKVREVGITRFFAPIPENASVDVRTRLNESADRLEAFLKGDGSGSRFSQFFDDLDVAGLRSCASWVPAGIHLSDQHFDELFGIATSGNAPARPGQSESDVFNSFRSKVEVFIEVNGFEIPV